MRVVQAPSDWDETNEPYVRVYNPFSCVFPPNVFDELRRTYEAGTPERQVGGLRFYVDSTGRHGAFCFTHKRGDGEALGEEHSKWYAVYFYSE